AEDKIYGRPPFNLRAKTVTLDAGQQSGNSRVVVSGAGLYYKNTRLLPVPSYVLRVGGGGGRRENQAFQLTPRVSFNSVDRMLVTTRLRLPLSGDSERLALNADIGASARIGFRGGLLLEARTGLGIFSLQGRRSDIVTTQLTNRIELDRIPELEYSSPAVPLFGLPGGHRAGLSFAASYGRFTERRIGSDSNTIRSTRQQAIIAFTTRLAPADGPYLYAFARASRYPTLDMRYRTVGLEVGYEGSLTRYIRGQFSYRTTSISGETPFRFDEVEIAREIRTTFDLQFTPRWLIPIDLRYDLDRDTLRDKQFGLLRSYKTFAYGVTYQTARHELRLELRRGF
ncbi:MAG TPA: hypothetical protein VNA16_07515, partial [Abditibacteriaceae bacterium]|nr:hypothetical protein [Abditibacteriaceae bacterium]